MGGVSRIGFDKTTFPPTRTRSGGFGRASSCLIAGGGGGGAAVGVPLGNPPGMPVPPGPLGMPPSTQFLQSERGPSTWFSSGGSIWGGLSGTVLGIQFTVNCLGACFLGACCCGAFGADGAAGGTVGVSKIDRAKASGRTEGQITGMSATAHTIAICPTKARPIARAFWALLFWAMNVCWNISHLVCPDFAIETCLQCEMFTVCHALHHPVSGKGGVS